MHIKNGKSLKFPGIPAENSRTVDYWEFLIIPHWKFKVALMT